MWSTSSTRFIVVHGAGSVGAHASVRLLATVVRIESRGLARLFERAPPSAAVVEAPPLELTRQRGVFVHDIAERRVYVDCLHDRISLLGSRGHHTATPSAVMATTATPRNSWRKPSTLAGTGGRRTHTSCATSSATTATAPRATSRSTETATAATTAPAICARSLVFTVRDLVAQPADLDAHERDRGDGARGEEEPQGRRQLRPVATSEHDARGDGRDANGTADLGEQAPAAAPHVEPQFDAHEREREGNRREPGPSGEDHGGRRERDQDGELGQGDTGRQPRAREPAATPPVDEHDLER